MDLTRYLIAAIVGFLMHVSSQSCIGLNGHNNNKYQSVLDSLSEIGYTIIEGNLTFLVNATHFYANPSSVYGIYQFATNNDIQQTSKLSWRPYSGCDAVLWTGCTPPKIKYFSFVPYIYQRFNPINASHRHTELLFASLGASINNLVVNSTDYMNWSIEHSINNNYDSLTTVITTADQQTFNDISTELTKSGLSKTINLNSIPAQYVYFAPYNDTTSDTQMYDSLAVLYRSALPENKTEYQQFIARNQTVYYIENKDCMQPRIPFEPITRNSTDKYDENTEYLQPFQQYKASLIDYFFNNLSYSLEGSYAFKQFYHEPEYHYGFECIDYDNNCLGDNRDAQYWSMNISNFTYFHLDDNTIFIVVGVNHHDVNMTVYSNVVLYSVHVYSNAAGPSINNYQSDESALILPIDIGHDNKYKQNMFVIQLSRPQNCINNLPGFCLNEHEWTTQTNTTFIVRDYLNPQTKTRPNHQQIIAPTVLQFTKSS